jgi:N-acetylglucosaminyl-diphospho-decaprenol L-rhamnosyltransferase
MAAPALDIVVVSFRCRELLRACLQSIRAHPPGGPVHVFVVDNDSRDGTVEMVESEFPEVELVASDINLGFSRANNLAIARGSAPYVLALNPDTRLGAGSLDRLLGLMEEQPQVGICGCRLEREDGSFDHAARRSFPTPLGALAHFARIGRSERAPKALKQYRAPDVESGPVDAVNGAFMLMRRAAFDEVGPFDEGFWMYMEDLDLCYRFAQAGWVTWYDPTATVVHVKGGTTGPRRSLCLDYAFHYGMFRFYRKHYAAQRGPFLNGLVYAGIALKLATSAARSGIGRGMRRLRGRPAV